MSNTNYIIVYDDKYAKEGIYVYTGDSYSKEYTIDNLSEFPLHEFHIGYSGDDNINIGGNYIVRAPFIPCKSDDMFNFTEGTLKGSIIINDKLYPAPLRDGFTNTDPIIADSSYKYEYSPDGTLSIYVPGKIDEKFIENFILLHDYGYEFHNMLALYRIEKHQLAKLSNDIRLVMRIPHQFIPFKTSIDLLWQKKKDVNKAFTDSKDLSQYHYMSHTCALLVSWFFTPDGYYLHKKHSKSLGYDWLRRIEGVEIKIPISCYIHKLLSHGMSDIPRFTSKQNLSEETYAEYAIFRDMIDNYKECNTFHCKIEDKIINALQQINQKKTRVILAGGFATTSGDNDLFIIDDHYIDIVMDLQSLLEIKGFTREGSILTSQCKKYQIIISSDLRSIEDVIYSFDFSSTMIAHDGYRYYVSPEFCTFISGWMSCMVLPVTKDKRLLKIQNKGMGLMHQHYDLCINYTFKEPKSNTSIEDIDIPQPSHIGYLCSGYGDKDNKIYCSDVVLGSEVLNYEFRIYADKNGISVGYYDIDPNKYYYIELIKFGDDISGLIMETFP